MDQMNGSWVHLMLDSSHAGNIEERVPDSGLGCAEADVDRCSG